MLCSCMGKYCVVSGCECQGDKRVVWRMNGWFSAREFLVETMRGEAYCILQEKRRL